LKIQCYFRLYWNESRLSYGDFANKGDPEWVIIPNAEDTIWIPDIFFVSAKNGKLHDLLFKNQVAKVSRTGQIMFSARLTLEINCPHSLARYPYDHPQCTLRIESFGKTAQELKLQWRSKDPVLANMDAMPREFHLIKITAGEGTTDIGTGSYSFLTLEFRLKRDPGFFNVHVILPSILLITFAGTSFYLNPFQQKCLVVRLSILLISLLVYAIAMMAVFPKIPMATELTAATIWIGGFLLILIMMVMELAFVFILGYSVERSKSKLNGHIGLKYLSEPSAKDDVEVDQLEEKLELPTSVIGKIVLATKTGPKLDVVSRIGFPLLITAFTIIYAIVYF